MVTRIHILRVYLTITFENSYAKCTNIPGMCSLVYSNGERHSKGPNL